MSDVVARLKPLLDQLTEEEWGEVIDYLVGSPNRNGHVDEDDPEFDAMLDRRFEEIVSGNAVGRPAFEVLDELRRKYLQ